jgi:hypothetical protein
MFALHRALEMPQIPTLSEPVMAEDKPVVNFVTTGTQISPALTAGPGVPADRVAGLRTSSYYKTMIDVSFLLETK